MAKLFKERCREKNHETMLSLMDELDEALEQRKRGDDKPLKRLLCGIDSPTQYAGHPNHTVCEGFEGESKESMEARICKCLFFKNAADPALQGTVRAVHFTANLTGSSRENIKSLNTRFRHITALMVLGQLI